MRTSVNSFLFSIAAAILALSCQKDSIDSGNPIDQTSTSLDIKLQASNTSFSLQKATSANPSLTWDSSYIVVSKIEFEAEKKDSLSQASMEINFEWKGPKTIDLFSLDAFVGSISLPPGVYHEISVKLESRRSDAGVSPVFFVAGSYTNAGGSVIPVVVFVNEDFEIRAKQEGFLLDASADDYTTLIHIHINLLMSGITTTDLENASQTDGTIVISASSNSDLYEKIYANLADCGESHFSKGRLEDGDDHGSHSGNDDNSDQGDDHGSNSGNDSASDANDDNGSNSGNGNGSGSDDGYRQGY